MTGVLLDTVVAGETLGVRQLCGLALVLAGILAGQPVAARIRLATRDPMRANRTA